MDLPAEAALEGWVWKEGEYNVSWRRRWFCIEGDELAYYKTNSKRDKQGVIAFSQVLEIDTKVEEHHGRKNIFVIVTPSRHFYLSGFDSAEKKTWVNCLNVLLEFFRSLPPQAGELYGYQFPDGKFLGYLDEESAYLSGNPNQQQQQQQHQSRIWQLFSGYPSPSSLHVPNPLRGVSSLTSDMAEKRSTFPASSSASLPHHALSRASFLVHPMSYAQSAPPSSAPTSPSSSTSSPSPPSSSHPSLPHHTSVVFAIPPNLQSKLVKLNVGGKKFETTLKTLTKFSPCYFTDHVILDQFMHRGEIFIDRNGEIFTDILDYLRDGVLFLPPAGSKEMFKLQKEAEFFGLSELYQTCAKKHSRRGQAEILGDRSEISILKASRPDPSQDRPGTQVFAVPPLSLVAHLQGHSSPEPSCLSSSEPSSILIPINSSTISTPNRSRLHRRAMSEILDGSASRPSPGGESTERPVSLRSTQDPPPSSASSDPAAPSTSSVPSLLRPLAPGDQATHIPHLEAHNIPFRRILKRKSSERFPPQEFPPVLYAQESIDEKK